MSSARDPQQQRWWQGVNIADFPAAQISRLSSSIPRECGPASPEAPNSQKRHSTNKWDSQTFLELKSDVVPLVETYLKLHELLEMFLASQKVP
ncbi:hypothetical protein MHYP_G00252080 [Metynnis hypsauchen]